MEIFFSRLSYPPPLISGKRCLLGHHTFHHGNSTHQDQTFSHLGIFLNNKKTKCFWYNMELMYTPAHATIPKRIQKKLLENEKFQSKHKKKYCCELRKLIWWQNGRKTRHNRIGPTCIHCLLRAPVNRNIKVMMWDRGPKDTFIDWKILKHTGCNESIGVIWLPNENLTNFSQKVPKPASILFSPNTETMDTEFFSVNTIYQNSVWVGGNWVELCF